MTKEVLKKKRFLLNILSCFSRDKQQTFPAGWNNPMVTKGIDREGTKTIWPPQDPALPPKMTKRKTDSLLESWQGHRILAASEVQPSFLFGHMLAAPPTQQVPSQVLRTRNRADKKAMANPGEWGAPTSGCLKAKSQAVVQRSNSYRCLLVFPSILNLERKGQYKIILL